MEAYAEEVLAHNLNETVELSPLVWLPIIQALAVANAVDLSHDVVNAASPNAYESSGYFFLNPMNLYSCLHSLPKLFV
jgi:hypothetical protein